MRGWKSAFAILISCAAQPSYLLAADPAPAKASDMNARQAQAHKLAQLTFPLDLLRSSCLKSWRQEMPAVLALNRDIKALEAEHPGVTKVMLAAAEPEILAQQEDQTRQVWLEVEALLARELALDDLDRAIAFYASPVGQRIVAEKSQNLVVTEINRRTASAGRADVRVFDLDLMAAQTVAVGSLRVGDRAQIAAFIASPTGGKLVQLAPELKRIAIRIADAPTPEFDVRIEVAMNKALDAFVAGRTRRAE